MIKIDEIENLLSCLTCVKDAIEKVDGLEVSDPLTDDEVIVVLTKEQLDILQLNLLNPLEPEHIYCNTASHSYFIGRRLVQDDKKKLLITKEFFNDPSFVSAFKESSTMKEPQKRFEINITYSAILMPPISYAEGKEIIEVIKEFVERNLKELKDLYQVSMIDTSLNEEVGVSDEMYKDLLIAHYKASMGI